MHCVIKVLLINARIADMNNFARLAVASIFFFAFLNNSPAQTQSVYTWTDEKGVVHYTDTPPDNPNAVEIPATEVYRPGSTGAYPQAEAAAQAESAVTGNESDPAAVASYADEQRKKMDEARKASAEKQAERARICKDARDQLESIEPSRRVFFTNEQGETERLDDEQRVAMVEQAKALIAENCD
jgi:Domain of unknown function (DUF4124)